MSKRNRDKRAANDLRIAGYRVIPAPPEEGRFTQDNTVYLYRSRKARRAQARLEKKMWSDLSEIDRLRF